MDKWKSEMKKKYNPAVVRQPWKSQASSWFILHVCHPVQYVSFASGKWTIKSWPRALKSLSQVLKMWKTARVPCYHWLTAVFISWLAKLLQEISGFHARKIYIGFNLGDYQVLLYIFQIYDFELKISLF